MGEVSHMNERFPRTRVTGGLCATFDFLVVLPDAAWPVVGHTHVRLVGSTFGPDAIDEVVFGLRSVVVIDNRGGWQKSEIKGRVPLALVWLHKLKNGVGVLKVDTKLMLAYG